MNLQQMKFLSTPFLRQIKDIVEILTNAIFRLVIFLCELVAVTDEEFASPNIEDVSYHQVTVMVEVTIESTKLGQ